MKSTAPKYPKLQICFWLLPILLFAGFAVDHFINSDMLIAHAQEGRDFPPEPLPEWSPPIDPANTENFSVSFDLSTGKELRLPVDTSPTINGSNFSDAPIMEGDEGFDGNPENFTPLEKVLSPSTYPWRVNVRLEETWPNAGSSCSGVLIDPKHVLTAGHCVYTFTASRCTPPATGCWADSVRVVPAYDSGATPYGEAHAVNKYTWTQWTDNHNYDWDMALIELDRPVGALTSWHGYGWDPDDSFFTGNTFHNPGYPGVAPYNGEIMYYWYGSYDTVETDVVYINRLSIPGQSGSGSYFVNASDQRHVYAVQSHNLGTDAGQTRITQNKFNTISAWISGNTPSSIDWVPLDVNVSPTTITAGSQFTLTDFLLHNYSSSAFNGTINYSYYLSTNGIISTGDTKLGDFSATLSLSAKGYSRRNLSPPLTIPPDTSGGTYWIGVILNVTDSNTGNNITQGWDAVQITVNTLTRTLTVSKNGTGSGTVTSSPTGISCGSTCSHAYNYNTSIILTATPSTGHTFAGWGGACSGTGTCVVSMTTARSVTATFNINTYTLSVSKNGTGSGTVTSSPIGIDCGSTCSHAYNYNTSVTLAATPSTGHTFAGWGGACSGSGSCVVSMTSAKSVTATFSTSSSGDDIDDPILISTLPSPLSLDTTTATTAVDDPAFTDCNRAPGDATVWYTFTPTAPGTLIVDTKSSSYDTILAIWKGTRGNLTSLGCNDDIDGSTTQSRVVASLTANTTYYIEVAQYTASLSSPSAENPKANSDLAALSGGNLQLYARWTTSKTYRSAGAYDGWILESSEFSNLGGTMNSTVTTLRLGDNAARKQYRSILSFNTSSLPNNAVITKVTLKIRKQGIVGGGNPVTMFQGFMADIRKGIFGTSALQLTDWQAAASKTVGPFTPSLSGGWYTLNLTSAKAYVNKLATSGGLTQIRLRFKLDDNNNAIANYLSLYSGNAGAASRPKLIIEYYVP